MSLASGPSQSRRVFLSYGHDAHSALAGRIRADLQLRGHEVWFDMEQLMPGRDWEAAIETGLDWVAEDPTRGRVVLLMTPHSVRRPDGFCLNEIARAITRRLPVVPVMVVWCEPPLSICRIQWLDMQDCSPPEDQPSRYESKFELLAAAIERGAVGPEGSDDPLLRLLEPLPFEADIAPHLSRFTGRRWILDEIDTWLADAGAPRVFWITGRPGAGKSALAAWLCHNRPEIAAFHLCRHGHAQKADPRRCVLSVAYQLSSQLPEYRGRLERLDLAGTISGSNARTLFDLLVLQPLSENFPRPGRTLVVLIDALDEAGAGGRNELAEFVASEFQRAPEWLRLIITSRPDPEVTQPLQGITPFLLDTTLPQNRDDLRAYLLAPPGGGRTTAIPSRESIDAILSRSDGLFLYVQQIREELQSGRLSMDRIADFPRGLGGIYWQFFSRRFPDVHDYRVSVLPALEFVAAAREPLHTALIARAMNWDPYRERETWRKVGSLFPVEEGRLQPFHRSVIEWLGDPEKAGPYFVSAAAGHERFTRLGWEEYRRGVHTLSPYMLAHLPGHLTGAGDTARLETLLSDLNYVEARCAAGQTFNLIGDYDAALAAARDNTGALRHDGPPARPPEKAGAAPHGDSGVRKPPETESILAVLRALSEERREMTTQAGTVKRLPDKGAHHDTFASTKSPAPRARDGHAPRFAPFAVFVRSHSHLLASYPGGTIPMARNHARSGPVVDAAEALTEGFDRAWIARDPRPPQSATHPACIATLRGHKNSVTGLALASDGQEIVSAGRDGTLRLWDLKSGICLRTISGHFARFGHVALARDGRTTVAAGSDGAIQLWRTDEPACLAELRGHPEEIQGVAVSGDGRLALSAGRDGSLRAWDLATGTCAHALDGHVGPVYGVAVSEDGRLAISCGHDKTIRVWDVENGRCLLRSRRHAGSLFAVAITPDGRFAASGGVDRIVRVWDLAAGRCFRELHGHEGTVRGIALSEDGSRVVSGSRDRTVRLWDVETGQCVRALAGHTNEVNQVALAGDLRIAVSSSRDRTIRVWDLEAEEEEETPIGSGGAIRGVALLPGGQRALAGGQDGQLRLLDIVTGRCTTTLTGGPAPIRALAAGRLGRIAASAGVDRVVRLWLVENSRCLREMSGHAKPINSVILSRDERVIYSAGRDRTIRVWDVPTGRCVLEMKGHDEPVLALAETPDGRTLVSGSTDRTIRIWDPDSGECLRTLQGGSGTKLALTVTPDGRRVVSAGIDKLIRVQDIRSGEPLLTIEGHAGWVRSVTVTPDGATILSGSYDNTVRAWDAGTGSCLAICPAGAALLSLAEPSAGGLFACGTENGLVHFLTLRGIPPSTPFTTATRFHRHDDSALGSLLRERSAEPLLRDGEAIAGCFDSELKAPCPWCGVLFRPTDRVLDAIGEISRNVQMPSGGSPCLSLPDEAWEDERLRSECPECRAAVRFNPLTADRQ